MSVIEVDLAAPPVEDLFDWPLFGLQDDVRPALAEARARGVWSVLATLYGVTGAAPRGVGAQMVFTEDGVVGFLSGGCIEADLAVHARRALTNGKAHKVVYGEGGPMDIRLPCGSKIEVLLEPLSKDDAAVARLLLLEGERRPGVWLSTGAERACIAAADDAGRLPAMLQGVSDQAASSDQICGYVQEPFAIFRAFTPRRRLIVIGADPIALAVVKLAVEMGVETTLVRPNGPETCPLAGVQYARVDAQLAITAARPDPWTAIAVLTHDVGQEQAAMTAALATNAGYVGVLGSRRRTVERITRLLASGVTHEDVRRIHAPIGLAIGSKSPWEIAISIVAEIVRDLDATRLS